MSGTRIRIHCSRRYRPEQIRTSWTADSRPRIPEIESAIESAWAVAAAKPGIQLFDGPMCRLESFAAGDCLELKFSRTSYKAFLGTNLKRPDFADVCGKAALANPVGISAALEADGKLFLGRRSAWVAYYPNRIHPFAGALEPADPLDIFEEMKRELDEELELKSIDIADMSCLGLVEDASIRQPELITHVRVSLSAAEIIARAGDVEHDAVEILPVEPQAVAKAIADPMLTPVAAATLLLWGRDRFGAAWFDEAARGVTLLNDGFEK